MSGLHDAFDQIVADVPTYGDLDRAIEQAERERRRRHGAWVGLVAAAAASAAIVGALSITSDDDNSQRPINPSPPTSTPSTTPTKSQSPRTWRDTPVTASHDGADWSVPDPLKAARDAWFPIVVDHLDPTGDHLQGLESSPFGVEFEAPSDGSPYSYPTHGRIGLVVDASGLDPLDGCRYLMEGPEPSQGERSCSEQRFAGPHGERARISSYMRLCGAFDGPTEQYATCGDYRVAVAVDRRDGLIGYVVVDGRGAPEINPFSRAGMAAVAADPRLALPRTAFTVPSDAVVASITQAHFPGYRIEEASSAPDHTGYAQVWGRLAHRGLSTTVQPAGGRPVCGRQWLVGCVERRVFGADDPTTVFVGEWEEADWADCCPKNSRAWRRAFVYVGPRHTVTVQESRVVAADGQSPGAELDQRLIDLALDPRLQEVEP